MEDFTTKAPNILLPNIKKYVSKKNVRIFQKTILKAQIFFYHLLTWQTFLKHSKNNRSLKDIKMHKD